MDNKKNIIGFFFFLFLFLVEGKETILAVSQDVSAVKAMQLFDAGKYVEAEKMFQLLLEKDGGNPMLNYYYGASRTENGHFDDRDLKYLQDAGKNVTPDRLHYYLGIQYHARNKWEQALKFYNQFRQSIPVEEQKTLNMAEKIQQCFDKINPFATGPVTFATEKNEPETESGEVPLREMREEPAHTEPEMPDAPKKPEADSVVEMPLTKTPEEGTTPPSPETQDAAHLSFAREALPDLPGVKATHSLPEGDPIEFQVNNTITYLYSSQFQTEEGRELFKKGRSLQKELENSLKEAESLRETYRNTNTPEEKAAIGEKILAFETNSYGRQEEINQYFSSSRNLENEYWNNAGATAIHNFLVEQEKIKAVLRGEVTDTEPSAAPADSAIVLLPGALSDFYDTNQTASKQQKSEGLVYKVQIGAYSRGVPSYRQRLYKKLSLIRKIENYTDENGVVVYTTGNLTNLDDGEKMKEQVRQEGIEDAVVVPYFNGKRITLEQAKKIEAEDDF
ncbi:hypothetical protein D1164_14765 [Mariniphaga sediminis]|uniref:Tetratricopeptide repeat protein n=1 Tax=Mariniphaga sediminis TaxID=1628158 RepID=A0A399D1U5_9BACT|nr:hypothetical protein [Mariniphaga sediminis]RIH64350.1 hypothetical protein D1164_14765 [Mariniphaga sediminis]